MDYKRLRLSHGFIKNFITKPKAEYLEKNFGRRSQGPNSKETLALAEFFGLHIKFLIWQISLLQIVWCHV